MKIGGIFMKNNRFKAYLLTGALTLGVIGAANSPALAATNASNTASDGFQGLKVQMHQNLDDATKEKIQSIMEDTKVKLAELGVTLPQKFEKGDRFANLDDATKEKVQAIMDQVKDGSLTHEDAQKQLTELGVDLPVRGGMHGDRFANLDDTTKEKAQAIMDKVKDGSLSREDAQKQLTELGVDLPVRGGKHGDPFANLDNATKEKAQNIMDEAKTQIKELIEE
jgi:polyhydroxyalkanoate synthesis regulator phasin